MLSWPKHNFLQILAITPILLLHMGQSIPLEIFIRSYYKKIQSSIKINIRYQNCVVSGPTWTCPDTKSVGQANSHLSRIFVEERKSIWLLGKKTISPQFTAWHKLNTDVMQSFQHTLLIVWSNLCCTSAEISFRSFQSIWVSGLKGFPPNTGA